MAVEPPKIDDAFGRLMVDGVGLAADGARITAVGTGSCVCAGGWLTASFGRAIAAELVAEGRMDPVRGVPNA